MNKVLVADESNNYHIVVDECSAHVGNVIVTFTDDMISTGICLDPDDLDTLSKVIMKVTAIKSS